MNVNDALSRGRERVLRIRHYTLADQAAALDDLLDLVRAETRLRQHIEDGAGCCRGFDWSPGGWLRCPVGIALDDALSVVGRRYEVPA